MADELQLQPDETVILRKDKIGYGSKMPSMMDKSSLVLTNRNLILQKKNFFGKTTETLRFPLSEVRIVNGVPQVQKGKADFMDRTLDIYFKNGMESFRFEWESDIDEWIPYVVAAVTGEPVKIKSEAEKLAEFASVVESIEEPIEKIQSLFGIKSERQVSCKCPSCGATLTGIKGETEQCPYCGSYYTF